jgi:hypothetical protein
MVTLVTVPVMVVAALMLSVAPLAGGPCDPVLPVEPEGPAGPVVPLQAARSKLAAATAPTHLREKRRGNFRAPLLQSMDLLPTTTDG